MFAVIFSAKSAELDEEYDLVAKRMKALALEKYGCIEFLSVAEGHNRLAISYWEDEAQILAWKKNSEHLLAQELGRTKWYESYRVQVVKILREYGSNAR